MTPFEGIKSFGHAVEEEKNVQKESRIFATVVESSWTPPGPIGNGSDVGTPPTFQFCGAISVAKDPEFPRATNPHNPLCGGRDGGIWP